MQVENRPIPSINHAALQRGAVNRTATVNAVTPEVSRQAQAFPDSPLISVQPLRYNTQLNEQLTRVQLADAYISQVESQTLSLSHAITRRSSPAEVNTQLQSLQTLLAQRSTLSGGAVDRHLGVNLEGESRVSFSLRDEQNILNNPKAEVLIFSLAGDKREISAVSLPADSSAQQNLVRLNRALGKWGISGTLDKQRQVKFDVTEPQWSRVSQQLSVQGGGERYPEGQFFPVKPQAETVLEDALQQIQQQTGRRESLLPLLETTLNTVTQQRRLLQQVQARVEQRISSMATFTGEASAQREASSLAESLKGGEFALLNQALQAQANVPASRVRNVLSDSR